MSEVFVSMKRLLAKYGKDLQQLSWHCVLQLLEKAVKLCREVSAINNKFNFILFFWQC